MPANGSNRRWRTPLGRCVAATTVLSAVSLVGWAVEQVSAGTGGMSEGCSIANDGQLNGFVGGGSVSVEFFQGETLIVESGNPANGMPTGTQLQNFADIVDSGGFPARLTYTFPSTGTYGMLWRVIPDVEATFTLTCTPAPPPTTTTTTSTTTTTTAAPTTTSVAPTTSAAQTTTTAAGTTTTTSGETTTTAVSPTTGRATTVVPPPNTGTLPTTGSSGSANTTAVALFALLGGALALLIARRRAS
jgi:LPXTG-motif cell wall-anchored protein